MQIELSLKQTQVFNSGDFFDKEDDFNFEDFTEEIINYIYENPDIMANIFYFKEV